METSIKLWINMTIVKSIKIKKRKNSTYHNEMDHNNMHGYKKVCNCEKNNMKKMYHTINLSEVYQKEKDQGIGSFTNL